MTINIVFSFLDGPYGGGNQFLKALRDYFVTIDKYEEMSENADVIIFNSHHNIEDILRLKYKFPNKIFIHRIDGPMYLYKSKDMIVLDHLVFDINKKLSDGTVFQSSFSRDENNKIGFNYNKYTTILNAPNSKIFYYDAILNRERSLKVKIIASSWSSNHTKGFDVYEWLDNNLDFDKYEMTFVGNSKIKFKNIKHILPLNSSDLAKILQENDIYITASQKDPCSNSLIEALHCGLPSLGLNCGGHPEIISAGSGEVFDKADEIPALLDRIMINYKEYQNEISLPNMRDIGNQYYEFCKSICDDNKYTPKRISLFIYYKTSAILFLNKVKNKFLSMIGY